MSRRHSGLVTSAVTLETLHFHCLNSHVKQRLLTARTNTLESVLTVLTLISKHYTSIGCLFPVLWSKLIRTLFLTLAPARSGQIGSVSAPKPSVSPTFSTGLTQIEPTLLQKKFSQNHSRTQYYSPPHSLRTLTHTPVSSGTLLTFCKLCVTRLCLLKHRTFAFYSSA